MSTTSHGSLSLGAGGMTYSPTPGFYGTDSFTYDVVDADGLVSNTVGVTINVGAGPPSVVAQAFTGAVGNTPLQVGGSAGRRRRRSIRPPRARCSRVTATPTAAAR